MKNKHKPAQNVQDIERKIFWATRSKSIFSDFIGMVIEAGRSQFNPTSQSGPLEYPIVKTIVYSDHAFKILRLKVICCGQSNSLIVVYRNYAFKTMRQELILRDQE